MSDTLDESEIFRPEELDRLTLITSLGDALLASGAEIVGVEKLSEMISAAEEHKRDFPYALSLEGSVTRQLSNDEMDTVTRVQLSQIDFAQPGEAINASKHFPLHTAFGHFINNEQKLVQYYREQEKRHTTALSVVRLLFGEPIEQRQKTGVAAGIDANTIYKVKP
ncbi:MAG: hypothetical protein AAB914_00955, partial [Patescibacteria group bacterium]